MNIIQDEFAKVKEGSYQLPLIPHDIKRKVVIDLANRLRQEQASLIKQNQLDLNAIDKTDPKYDRCLLNTARIEAIAHSLEKIAEFESPIWKILEEYKVENGLKLQKRSVPLGVIGIIYESRPNVTIDSFVLCFMSSNACILKGGSDAKYSNEILVKFIHQSLAKFDVPKECVILLPSEREAVKLLFHAKKIVDVIIPRGSQALIDYVKKNSEIPIIETGAGVVHIYFDLSADKEKGKKIITNAKTRRVSVCNALDCLIIHKDRLNDLFNLVSDMVSLQVQIYADDLAFKALAAYPKDLLHKANISDYGTEFLDYKLAIKTVTSFDAALDHILQHSSGHSEAIIAEDEKIISAFFQRVDAAVVYANASTAFTDGGEFGMGGEIGISTQKLHVRGPFSMQHLVSYKWLVTGDGQTR